MLSKEQRAKISAHIFEHNYYKGVLPENYVEHLRGTFAYKIAAILRFGAAMKLVDRVQSNPEVDLLIEIEAMTDAELMAEVLGKKNE